MRKIKFAIPTIYLFGLFSNAFAFEDTSMWTIHNDTGWAVYVKCTGTLPAETSPRFEVRTRAIAPYSSIRQIWYIDSEMQPASWQCVTANSDNLIELQRLKYSFDAPWRGITKLHIRLAYDHLTLSQEF